MGESEHGIATPFLTPTSLAQGNDGPILPIGKHPMWRPQQTKPLRGLLPGSMRNLNIEHKSEAASVAPAPVDAEASES